MRLKRFTLSPEGLCHALRTGSHLKIVGEGVPQDGKVVRVFPNHETGCIELVVESESYEDLLVGCLIPQADPIIIESARED
jgi:hypothetical protein